MLLRPHGDDVIAIGQPSHAWVSGQLARSWGNERFGAVTPREEVCLAAEQHDVGMSLWDLEPTLNPDTGRPHSFLEMPIETHLELWSDAPRRLLAQSRYAALLVSMHGTALYERRDLARLAPAQARAVRDYLAAQRALQHDLIAALRADAVTDALVRRNQRLVFAWDFLSLALCLDWAPRALEDVPLADASTAIALAPAAGGDPLAPRATLDPWPFETAAVELQAEGRLLRGRFDDERALRAALDAADWLTLRFTLLPPG